MRRFVTLAASLALTAALPAGAVPQASGTAAPPDPVDGLDAGAARAPEDQAAPAGHLAAVRLPGFAAALANERPIVDATGWPVLSDRAAWQAIARATERSRQAARWNYARSLLGRGRAPEAHGVLVTMAQDDPDLALVPTFRLAMGATFVELGRPVEALDALSAEQLAGNPEACAWRMRAMAAGGLAADAFGQWSCARSAIASRRGEKRKTFLLAAAEAAAETDRPARALALLAGVSDADAAANLVRGRALFRLGKEQDGRLRLEQAADNGAPEQRVDAQVSLLEALADHNHADPQKAYAALERLGYGWRGGSIERRSLALRFRLADAMHDDRAALRAGAALFRHHPAAQDSAVLLNALQDKLRAILSPDSKLPLPEAAGLFWDYRDLSPSGARGDFLVSQLADRLQAARLYERAAQLLDYQLTARARDVTQGPLSVRVARLYVLAGEPREALRALRASDGNLYPTEMIHARLTMEAVALHQIGRVDEALAVLDGVPDGDAIRAEIEWNRRNWRAIAGPLAQPAPRSGGLSDVEQTIVLRQAVALAMLGQEAGLVRLRARYAPSFAGLPTAAAFDLLTGPVAELDPDAIVRAMAAMPAASPAGDIADLLTGSSSKTPPAKT